MEKGEKIKLRTKDKYTVKQYREKMKSSGKTETKNDVCHSELIKGANIVLDRSDTTNTKRGVNDSDFPYSLTNE